MRASVIFFSSLVLAAAGLQQYVAFDAASASSTYSAGNLAGSPAFAAQQALSGGSGYWWATAAERITVFVGTRVSAGAPAAATQRGRARV